MICRVYEPGKFKDLKYAETFALYKGKWILCKHKERDTWEIPGGHMEAGETPEEAAKRELYEEAGASATKFEPICEYWFCYEPDEQNEKWKAGSNSTVAVFFAEIENLDELPDFEMEEIELFDNLPSNLNEYTYPDAYRETIPWVLKHLLSKKEAGNTDVSIAQMMEMQINLHNRYESWKKGLLPNRAQNHLFWMTEEVGEVISVVKKHGDIAIMDNPEIRAAFIEEAADVLAYLTNALLCYDVSPAEWSETIINKHKRNMTRNWPQH